MKQNEWTQTDLGALPEAMKQYQDGKLNKDALRNAFGGRSFNAIYQKAQKLTKPTVKVTRNPRKVRKAVATIKFLTPAHEPRVLRVLEGNRLVHYVEQVA